MARKIGAEKDIRQHTSRSSTIYLKSLAVSFLLVVTILVGPGGPLASTLGLIGSPVVHAKGQTSVGTPNHFDPHTGTTSVTQPNPQAPHFSSANQASGTPQVITRNQPPVMKPGIVALGADQPAYFLGSDGRLDVQVPAGAVTASDIANAGGNISLRVTQIAPASGSNAGGSGLVSFGTYLIQLVDGQGNLMASGTHKPVTLKLHYDKHESALDLSHAFVVFNASLPSTLDPTTIAAYAPSERQTIVGNPDVQPNRRPKTVTSTTSTAVTPASIGLGTMHSQTSTLDTSSQVMTISAALASPSTSMSWNTDAAIASFGKPDPFNVNLNAGSLQSGFPIDVPAGPGGLTPPINVSYSSASVAEQHNPQASAGWVGEGWNLSLGSISWAEHNVTSNCVSSCGNTWEDSWQLSDAFGTAGELIPPNINVSTYFDDTPNNYCGADGNANNASSYPCPIQWHMEPDSHVKVFTYVGPLSLPDGAGKAPPCFRVFLPNGIMEEFGCTADSLEYYYTPGMGDYISSWNLDLITDPQGNQIHVTYQQDVEQMNVNGTNHQYIRDAQLATVQWDSPTCHDAQNACTGSNWAPLMQVNFVASHNPTNLTNAPSNCNTGANLRCDNPLDLSGSGGMNVPLVQSTFVLDDVQVQVRNSGSGSWNTLKDYEFSYAQNGPTTPSNPDPSTGKSESVAGSLLLSKLEEMGDQGVALMYSGMDNSSTQSYAYLKAFDLSSQNLVVTPNTTLTYWVYPQYGAISTCVALDLIFTDGSDLRDSGAVDQHNVRVHPAYQCGHLQVNQWNKVVTKIGQWESGKTLLHVDVAYDQPGNTGGYRGYVDDISFTDGNSVLFSSTFESGQPQPTWTNTVDSGFGSEGGSSNVGGYCCGLGGPELGTRAELSRTPSLPPRTFDYTAVTEYYEDDAYHPTPTTNCGPSWNTGNGSGCLLWSQSYAGNSYYLSSASNGLGLQQTFNWQNGRNNTHGVNGGGSNNANPFYCNASQGSYPCNEADDQNWSHVLLTQEQGQTVRAASSGNTTVTSTDGYAYKLTYPLAAQECSDCVAGMYWGNQNDGDYLDYYNAKFMGLTEVDVSQPDGALEVHKYHDTNGYGVYDTGQVNCYSSFTCHNSPWWAPGNLLHGRQYETDSYDASGNLLGKTTTQYHQSCPSAGVGGTPASSTWGNWDGMLVSELDHNNPVASCDVEIKQADSYSYEGSSNAVHSTTTYNYDGYGRVTSSTTNSNGGGAATGSASAITQQVAYVQNDAVNASYGGVTGTYLVDVPAFSATTDGNGNRYSCAFTSYDGHGYTTGQTSNLTLGEATTIDVYTNCGSSANNYTASGLIEKKMAYDAYGNEVGAIDPDANAGNASHLGCTVGSTQYTNCAAYDSTFAVLPVSTTDVLGQTNTLAYATPGAANGYGLWPASATDANGQVTAYRYDLLGREISQTLPSETSGLTTTSEAYTTWCAPTGAQTPCTEVDRTQRLNSSTTVTTRAFYDGYGRLVETRTPGANNQDVVQYYDYDVSGRLLDTSVAYFVASYTGAAGAAAFSTPDVNQVSTTNTYDAIGRVTSTKDALGNTEHTHYSVVCNAPGTSGDTACYEQALQTDALGHQTGVLTDAFEREIYDQRYTGNGSSGNSYALYATTRYTYDFNGNVTQILHPDGTTKTTYAYDATGRLTSMSDPDRGTEAYSYDANGNVTSMADARGASGTTYAGYDPLNRQLWRNTTNSSAGAYVTYGYDGTANGNLGTGRLTSETFTGGPNNSLSGSYTYVYDGRGQVTSMTAAVGTSSFTTGQTYDDTGHPIATTYPDGEVVTTGYTAQDWFAGLTVQKGSNPATTLVNSVNYSGNAGAAGLASSMSLGGGVYTASATYDPLTRATDSKLTRTSNGATLFDEARTYDVAGNVSGITTTVPQGTDTQAFCYDEQNRVTWAGSTGTSPCTGTAITAGTLTAAQYSQSFTYDTLGRLTSGPLGTSTYGDATHVHAATAIGSGTTPSYTATYDAAGNMICRAPTSSSTCTGTSPTGQQFGYDNEGRLITWQNAPTSPSSTDAFLYDGEGNRVEQQSTTGLPGSPSTTTTIYVGALEEVQTTGSTTTTTVYYYAGAKLIASAVNGTISYLATNALGSPTVALNAAGQALATTLYAPYGGVRYTQGTMPLDNGFTGQRADAMTGLDYYGSRYYDPLVGQFTSADTILPGGGFDPWGLSRYAYVEGNPISMIDPTGHNGFWGAVGNIAKGVLDATTGIPSMISDVQTIADGKRSTRDKLFAAADLGLNIFMDATMVIGVGEGLRAAYVGARIAEDVGAHVIEHVAEHVTEHVAEATAEHTAENVAEHTAAHVAEQTAAQSATHIAENEGEHAAEHDAEQAAAAGAGCGLSFAATTLVLTPSGTKAIASLKAGDAVTAYNPATGAASTQTVQAMQINHDADLLDVTLVVAPSKTSAMTAMSGNARTSTATHGGTTPLSTTASATASSAGSRETVHTTDTHPWLTADRGWLPASFLRVGEPVVRADGTTATVAGVRGVEGAAVMYDLTVSQVHTFAVGTGAYVVHNCGTIPGSSREVIVDTSATYHPQAAQAALQEGEEGVITETTANELTNNLSKTPPRKIPNWARSLPIIPDAPITPGTLTKISGLSQSLGAVGVDGDVSIIVTAIESDRPVITADRGMADVLSAIGHDVRFIRGG